MKNLRKPLLFSLVLLGFMAIAQIGFSQAPPPPPPAGPKGGSGNNNPGGSAPIDGGLAISLAMIAGFGAWKLLKAAQGKKHAIES